MDSNKTEIDFLRESIEKLISMHNTLKEDNQAFKTVNINLQKEIEQLNTDKGVLSKKIETLKLAKTIEMSSEDTHDAKIKINRIVRDIDECIALMNK